jgi:hypothetical protein
MSFNNEQSSSDIMSLYIPYVRNEYDENYIRSVFQFFQIGDIERVDFFRSEQVGSQWPWARSAFVHLKEWYFNAYTDALYLALTDSSDGFQWKITFGNQGEFWIIKKMTIPKIPATDLNIHQIAAKIGDLEAEVARLREEAEWNTASRLLSEHMAQHVLDDGEPMDIAEFGDADDYADMPPLVPVSDDEEEGEVLHPNITIRAVHRSVSPMSVANDLEYYEYDSV